MTTPPLIPCGDRVLVILDGRPRQLWHKTRPERWQLDGIWPDPQQRRKLEWNLRIGTRLLVVLASPGEAVDVLDEELPDHHPARRYATCQEGGITSLYVPSLDWLPSRLAQQGHHFITENTLLREVGRTSGGPALSPRMGPHGNLRILHAPTSSESYLTPGRRDDIARLAFASGL